MWIELGALAKDLHVQVGCKPEEISGLQNDADAITRLYLNGLLTEAETEKARTRLMRKITAKVKNILTGDK